MTLGSVSQDEALAHEKRIQVGEDIENMQNVLNQMGEQKKRSHLMMQNAPSANFTTEIHLKSSECKKIHSTSGDRTPSLNVLIDYKGSSEDEKVALDALLQARSGSTSSANYSSAVSVHDAPNRLRFETNAFPTPAIAIPNERNWGFQKSFKIGWREQFYSDQKNKCLKPTEHSQIPISSQDVQAAFPADNASVYSSGINIIPTSNITPRSSFGNNINGTTLHPAGISVSSSLSSGKSPPMPIPLCRFLASVSNREAPSNDNRRKKVKICRMDQCDTPAAKKKPYCEKHCGVRRCEHGSCDKCAQGRTRFCVRHGGGRRCMYPNCKKGARDTRFCAAHGGGKRCHIKDCLRSAVGGFNACTSHGGGRRCQFDDCSKSAQSSTNFCVRHGGGRKCSVPGCFKTSRGRSVLCMSHGGFIPKGHKLEL